MSAKTKILVLAANPRDTEPLQLAREVQGISDGLERSRLRDRFEIKQVWAAGTTELRRAMLDMEPHIVHFSGHGKGREGLVFHAGDSETSQLIRSEALADFFELFSDQLECVVLSGCSTDAQAPAISRHIRNVVGFSGEISDAVAMTFAVAFYDALGAGRPIEFAYKMACTAVRMEDHGGGFEPVFLSKKDEPDNPGSPGSAEAEGRVKILISYASDDEALLDELTVHLSQLKRQKLIETWHDRDIEAGIEKDGAIDEQFEAADLILLLISPSFMASDNCYNFAMQRAMEKQAAGNLRVVPVILRPVDWGDTPFARLQALPSRAKPVTSWPDRDTAWLDVVQGIRAVCKQLLES